MLDDSQTDPLWWRQNRAPLRITVRPSPPPNGPSGNHLVPDGIDDWIVPGTAPVGAVYPDDWIVPGNARADPSYPDDWIVPGQSAIANSTPAAANIRPGAAGIGPASASPAPSANSFAAQPDPFANYFSLIPAAQIGAMAWHPPIFPTANPYSPDNLPASAWLTAPPIFPNTLGKFPSMGSSPSGLAPISAANSLYPPLPNPQSANPTIPEFSPPLRSGTDWGYGDVSTLLSLLRNLSSLDQPSPSIAYGAAKGFSGFSPSAASAPRADVSPIAQQADSTIASSAVPTYQIVADDSNSAGPTDVAASLFDQPSDRPDSFHTGIASDQANPVDLSDQTLDSHGSFTPSQTRAPTELYRNALSFIGAYLRDSAEGIARVPADLAVMVHDAVTDFPEFLRKAEPGLAGLGLSIPMTRAAGIVWKLNDFTRGRIVELVRGHNLPFTYPTIDNFENGIVTSIKSLNLNAPSYKEAKALYDTLRGYINEVANFTGRRWARVDIEEHQITGRTLDVVVPHSGSVVQKSAIERAIEHGARQGVTVNIIRHQ